MQKGTDDKTSHRFLFAFDKKVLDIITS